eukprot:scaffold135147_cov47-Cyclotella_meneghiniana.AAC.1
MHSTSHHSPCAMNPSILRTPEKEQSSITCSADRSCLEAEVEDDVVLSSSVVLSPARPGAAPLPQLPPLNASDGAELSVDSTTNTTSVSLQERDSNDGMPSANSGLQIGCRMNNFLDVYSSSCHAAKLSGMKQSQIAYKAKIYFDKNSKTEGLHRRQGAWYS